MRLAIDTEKTEGEVMIQETNGARETGQLLIVDDDAAQLFMEQEILEGEGYCVQLARSGEAALSLLKEHRFDAVLLDQKMPGLSGDDVCRIIRQQEQLSLLPIIIVTGSDDNHALSNSLRIGATDFIRKPYSSIELVARVNAAVTQKRKTDELDNAESLLFALARMVEAKDEQTGNHCSRLASSAVVFGKALGLGALDLDALRRGGVLHDIGKLAVPDKILLKNGPLNETQWEVMQQHTVVGAQLCQGLKSMERVIPIIRSHHERWDGGGYPDGLRGEQIPLLARVFQLVDIYDALTHERPYKEAWSIERVIAMLEEEKDKGWRDPQLTDVFLNILRTNPASLAVPSEAKKDASEKIFEQIQSSGILSRKSALGIAV